MLQADKRASRVPGRAMVPHLSDAFYRAPDKIGGVKTPLSSSSFIDQPIHHHCCCFRVSFVNTRFPPFL